MPDDMNIRLTLHMCIDLDTEVKSSSFASHFLWDFTRPAATSSGLQLLQQAAMQPSHEAVSQMPPDFRKVWEEADLPSVMYTNSLAMEILPNVNEACGSFFQADINTLCCDDVFVKQSCGIGNL